MGMTKAALDLQIQTETQKAIGTLQANMGQLDKMLQIVDGNMRMSHMALFRDLTQMRIRVNFLMGELKSNLTEEEVTALEERFKVFSKDENEKFEADINRQIREREAAIAAKQQGGPGSENTPNVIQ